MCNFNVLLFDFIIVIQPLAAILKYILSYLIFTIMQCVANGQLMTRSVEDKVGV